MDKPDWVTNEASWKKHCRRVVARTTELIEGKVGMIDCSREIGRLAFWLRAEKDPDFVKFQTINKESEEIPSIDKRQKWPGEARDIETKKIEDIEARWKSEALAAAISLREKFDVSRLNKESSNDNSNESSIDTNKS